MSVVDSKPLVQSRTGKAVLISERDGLVDSASQPDLEVTTTKAILCYLLDPGEEGRQRWLGRCRTHGSRGQDIACFVQTPAHPQWEFLSHLCVIHGAHVGEANGPRYQFPQIVPHRLNPGDRIQETTPQILSIRTHVIRTWACIYFVAGVYSP